MNRARLMTLIVCAACTASCQREEKIVSYKPFFTGLQDAKTQTPAVSNDSKRLPLPNAAEGEKIGIVRENPDGTVTLIATSGRHLMSHILRTLQEDKQEQFTQQVLSDITRNEYVERGLDPAQAFATLKKEQKEISKLFNRMPMGEYSPNVIMETMGRNLIRVKVTGQSKKGLEKWTGFDMILERGNWRLRWFVT